METNMETNMQNNNLDQFSTKMCLYFRQCQNTIKNLERDMDKQFVEFKDQINQMPSNQRSKYDEYMKIMSDMQYFSKEGDWPNQIWFGECFASHYLDKHDIYDIKNEECFYCQVALEETT